MYGGTDYYVLYTVVCGALVAGITLVLHWAGDVFLHDSFRGQPELARAVARLLDVGLYLVSLGYFAVTFRSWSQYGTRFDLLDAVVTRAGFLLLILGFLHVVNLLILALFRSRRDGTPSAAVS